MPKTLASGASTVNPSLLAFRPRQVALTTLDMKQSKANGSADKAVSLSSDKKALLFHSVARFLERNGFSKTLKKFCSEAEIEEIDAFKGSLPDLEALFSKYSDKCDGNKTNSKGQKEQELKLVEPPPEEPENNSKDKKKRKKRISELESLPNATGEQIKEASLEGKSVTDSKREKKTKDKEKKNKPPTSASLIDNTDSQAVNSAVLNAYDTLVEEKSSKSKTKKKKKDDLAFECSDANSKDTSVIGSKGDDFKKSSADADATGKDDKGSKKRKRLISEENDLKPADKIEGEECKRKKIKGVDDFKVNDQQAHVNASAVINKLEEFQNNSIKQLNGQGNGNIDESAEKSSIQKSTKKQHNGSAEPKTVCAFQRVKVDEVVFTDERLQDNSYWAKHGAETGYGAKAQEVLGQVRGSVTEIPSTYQIVIERWNHRTVP
ncbi:LIS motif containing protein [Trema orientale]|uniref:LIS motif containing protein n=1 Tax=Trema orientale TaxID=63057 RepID=A0A2P5DQ68_TREOI|nr:LIS motif containing protein [Trema orientale]